jgi:hypothetical protein
MRALNSLIVVIAGFDASREIGVLNWNGTITPIPGTRSISFVTKAGDGSLYAVDENYGGSRLFRLRESSGAVVVADEAAEPACRGAVFIEKADDRLFIPCFGSDSVWVVDGLFRTERMLATGHRPHAAYIYRDRLYVPCRGDRGDRSDEIRVYDAGLRELSPIRLGGRDPGPRHIVFVDDSFYAVAEFGGQVFRFSIPDYRLLGIVDLVVDGGGVATASEIRYDGTRDMIITGLRYDGLPGSLVFLDSSLAEIRRVGVGKNPRFFDLCGEDSVLVLNQDDRTTTRIRLDTFETETSGDIGMNPQSFCTTT